MAQPGPSAAVASGSAPAGHDAAFPLFATALRTALRELGPAGGGGPLPGVTVGALGTRDAYAGADPSFTAPGASGGADPSLTTPGASDGASPSLTAPGASDGASPSLTAPGASDGRLPVHLYGRQVLVGPWPSGGGGRGCAT
ncbi:hypothetical protein BU197_15055, partial [Streptomyces sp. CBMA291]|nr:hypothetical protein [Streptomyces sp. CBMA291]